MRSTEGYSLERRLLTGLSSVLAFLALGLVLLIAAYADRASERAYDRLLLGSALSVVDGIRLEDGRITADLPYAAIAGLAAGGRDRIFYRISDPAGLPITGYPDLGSASRSPTPTGRACLSRRRDPCGRARSPGRRGRSRRVGDGRGRRQRRRARGAQGARSSGAPSRRSL